MSKLFLVVVIGYLLGNFATAYILGKATEGKDIRSFGSGNSGATNALRVFGLKIAAITFVIDALKGVAAVLLGWYILGDTGALIAGASVIVGHNWPIILRFKGGKGVASSIGVVLTVNYVVALICIVIGLIIIVKTKYVSLGSITALGLLPIVGLIVIRPFDIKFFVFTIVLALMAIYRHRTNISRLLNGKENKIGQKA